MKRVIVAFTILTVAVLANADATVKRLALLGDSLECDRLTAELSGDRNIELLERGEIEKILKEHKLSAAGLLSAQLLRYFPHVDIFAFVSKDRLLVFNAKNGFRLMDSVAGDTTTRVKQIRQAVHKVDMENPAYISIAAVYDLGVPRRYKTKIKTVVSGLEQALTQNENIQVLERSKLELVIKERDLTGKRFPLKSSTLLITLRFKAGEKADIVKLELSIHNLRNKEIGRAENPDAFKNVALTVRKLSDDTAAILKKKTN
jgi:hypothetical protein